MDNYRTILSSKYKMIKVFPTLTEQKFLEIYRKQRADKQQIDKLMIITSKIEKVLKDCFGDTKFILSPFGSLTNGFLMKNNYDLDLALLVEDESMTLDS